MRRVSQKVLVQVDERGVMTPESPRGDCVPACIASIFEIPLEEAPGMGGNSQAIWDWLALNYSGIGMVVRDWNEPKAHHHNNGFWIATVVSSRYRLDHCCRCITDRRRKSNPPYFWSRAECPHCHGTGEQQGLHAIVMEYGRRVWDPHPDVDWDTEPQIVGETIFTVTDPARLAARTLPRPL